MDRNAHFFECSAPLTDISNISNFDGFEPVLPSDLATYERYRLDSLKLFEARRQRILDEIERRCPN